MANLGWLELANLGWLEFANLGWLEFANLGWRVVDERIEQARGLLLDQELIPVDLLQEALAHRMLEKRNCARRNQTCRFNPQEQLFKFVQGVRWIGKNQVELARQSPDCT